MWAIPLWTVFRSFFFPFLTLMPSSYSARVPLRLGTTGRGNRFPRFPDGRALTLSGSSVGPGPLPSDWQALAMSQPAIRARVHQTLDAHRDLLAKVPFYLVITFDDFSQFDDFLFAQILDPGRTAHPGLLQDLQSGRTTNPENIGQSHIHPFLSW